MIIWELKKVMENAEMSYTIVRMPEKILGFVDMEDRTLLVNLEYSMIVLQFGSSEQN